jgi:sigma-E factor negative regulatory protein RseB
MQATPVLASRARALRFFAALAASGVFGFAGAQAAPPQKGAAGERTLNEWLVRMHDASRLRSYIGTFVVSSGAATFSSARIWHACEGEKQVERVENLTGAPRSTFRRNDDVLTFIPEHRVVRAEKRESLGLFPDVLKPSSGSIGDFYTANRIGADRVAGYDTDVVQLAPKDALRFGYRIWSEKKTGLVVKLQTLDREGAVLEQAAFSELQLDAPLKPERLAQQMAVPPGWRVEKAEAQKTNAAAEGWGLKAGVAGFSPMSCWRRISDGGVLQWIFSDGLASVSLFIEPFDRQRHQQEGAFSAGATHTFVRRLQDWWVTAVGEVPVQTLRAFAENLERRK